MLDHFPKHQEQALQSLLLAEGEEVSLLGGQCSFHLVQVSQGCRQECLWGEECPWGEVCPLLE